MGNQGTIMLQEVINKIDAGEVFDLEFCTFDRKKGTAGRLVSLSRVVKHMNQVLPKAKLKAFQEESDMRTRKNPHHRENATRNLYLPDKQEIRKVHIRLITLFNGKRVL